MAPVVASGSWPAWIARVANPRSCSVCSFRSLPASGSQGARRDEGKDVGAGDDTDRVATVEYQRGRLLVERLDHVCNWLADADGGHRRAADLANRAIEHGAVAIHLIHQLELAHRADDLLGRERQFLR